MPLHHHFAGFLPFLMLNTLFVSTMPILFSSEKKAAMLDERDTIFQSHFRAHVSSDEKKWAY